MSPPSALKAVFFDLDDTLVWTSVSRLARAKLAFERVCRDFPTLNCEQLVAGALEPVGLAVRGVVPVLRETGLLDTEAGREAQGIWFFRGCYELMSPFEGMAETVCELANSHGLGVLTNGREEIQLAKFSHLAVHHEFRWFVSSETAGFEKPDLGFFQYVLELTGLQPSECMLVGDSLEIDVSGAKSAGMTAVWFNHRREPAPTAGKGPDFTIFALPELLLNPSLRPGAGS